MLILIFVTKNVNINKINKKLHTNVKLSHT